MLYQNVAVQPQFISAEESDLLSNLEFVEVAPEEKQDEAEIISAQIELVKERNRTAIAAVISPKVRLLSQTKTVERFNEYLHELDIEIIEFNMAMKP